MEIRHLVNQLQTASSAHFDESIDLTIQLQRESSTRILSRVTLLGTYCAGDITLVKATPHNKYHNDCIGNFPVNIINELPINSLNLKKDGLVVVPDVLAETSEVLIRQGFKTVRAKRPIKTAALYVDRTISIDSKKSKTINITVGKSSFPTRVVVSNIRNIIQQVFLLTPNFIQRQRLFKRISISRTMSKSIVVWSNDSDENFN